MDASLNSLPQMMQLLEVHGVQTGGNCQSRRKLTSMVHSIGQSMHDRLLFHILTTRSPLSLIIDGSTDYGQNHYLSVIFVIVEDVTRC